MKAINAYKTTDGKIFESEAKAKEHQIDLDINSDLDTFLNTKDTTSGFDNEFIDFVIENRKELSDILNSY